MRYSILVVLAALALPAFAAHWGGSGGGFSGGGHGWSGGGGGGWSHGGGGGGSRASAPPSSHGMGFTRNSAVTRSIASRQGVEVVPNHYYYHNEGGSRYWHYYGGGLHWYGFYYGPGFYWFPFYAGWWWWYDVNYARWAYWYDGYWWWNGPGGVPYVYVNDAYVPYDQYRQEAPADASGKTPAPPTAPPSTTPNASPDKAPAKEGSTYDSPDGKRMVQIVGSEGGAFLFDESAKPPSFIKYLGPGAEKIRFSGGTSGQPAQILVEFKNGTFAVLDEDGNAAGGASPPPGAPAR